MNLFQCFSNDPVVCVISLRGQIKEGGGKAINLGNTRKMVDEAFKHRSLKAVILNINSPGGSPVQSDLVSTYIKDKAASRKVPVITFVEDMAASGGYWLACTGTEIYAARSSIVGSIGVISASFGFHKLMEKYGVERRIYTAGENKSFNDPFMPEKEKDVIILKRTMEAMHQHFIDHVKASRGDKLSGDEKLLFNGEFWTAEAALELGLIDGIENMEALITRKYCREGRVKVIRVKRKRGLLERLIGSPNSVLGGWT